MSSKVGLSNRLLRARPSAAGSRQLSAVEPDDHQAPLEQAVLAGVQGDLS